MGVAEFTMESLYNIQEKLYLSVKYVNNLVEMGYAKEELENEGKYYKVLKEKYKQIIDEELWEKVKLGNLTVMSKEK